MHAARSGATLFVTVIGVTLYRVGLSSAPAHPRPRRGPVGRCRGRASRSSSETPNTTGPESLTRQFDHEHAIVELTVIPVTTPPGVRDVFGLFSAADGGFDSVPEPALDLAGWLVSPGSQVGDNGDATLVFASRDHVFVFAMFTDELRPGSTARRSSSTSPNARSRPPAVRRHRSTRHATRSHDDELARAVARRTAAPSTASRRPRPSPGRTSCRSTTRSSPTSSTS